MDHRTAMRETLNDGNFRIAAIWWLATCNDGEDLPMELADHAEDNWMKIADAVGHDGCAPTDVAEYGLADWLENHNKFGFLAYIETPVPVTASGSNYGWGLVRRHWVYADTLDELVRKSRELSDAFVASTVAELAGTAP